MLNLFIFQKYENSFERKNKIKHVNSIYIVKNLTTLLPKVNEMEKYEGVSIKLQPTYSFIVLEVRNIPNAVPLNRAKG